MNIPEVLQKVRYIFSFIINSESIVSKKDLYLCGVILDIICLILVLSTGVKPSSKFASPVSSYFVKFTSNSESSFVLSNGKQITMPDLQGLFFKNMRFKDHITKEA